MKKHTESWFEEAIIAELCQPAESGGGGYELVNYNAGPDKDAFDRARALDPARLLRFIASTQPKAWAGLKAIHGEDAERLLIEHLCKELDTKGVLKVLRQGFKCYGKKFRVAIFAPANAMNPDTLAAYAANQWSVARQLHYSTTNNNSLDLVLLLNGLPLVTAELKNPLSGQTVQHAIRQYKKDRDANETIFAFKKRSLVHFAIDQDAVFMTTRLSGDKTFFLPFNLGNQHHAGNPPATDGGYRTSYLWREVWQRDSLLDIVGRFMHLQTSEKRILTSSGTKTITTVTMIFPRYHQLDCVRKMVESTRRNGPGKKLPDATFGGIRKVEFDRLAGSPPVVASRRERQPDL